MAKGHFVAQTYLKHFSIKGLSRRVNAIRKSDLKILNGVDIREICQQADWTHSPYHQPNPKIVEEYLKVFEPRWNWCIKALRKDIFNFKIKKYVAGYLAFLRACTPTAVRLSEANLQEVVQMTYKFIAQRELKKKESRYVEAFRAIESSGWINVDIDSGYSKGMSFQGVINLSEKYVKFEWSILLNQSRTPFLTSDNPVCIERLSPTYCEFYIPLTPNLGLIIHPDCSEKETRIDELCNIEEEGVRILNETLIKNAEDMIIFNTDDWETITDLVKKYRNWRVENKFSKIPVKGGYLQICQEIVSEKRRLRK